MTVVVEGIDHLHNKPVDKVHVLGHDGVLQLGSDLCFDLLWRHGPVPVNFDQFVNVVVKRFEFVFDNRLLTVFQLKIFLNIESETKALSLIKILQLNNVFVNDLIN